MFPQRVESETQTILSPKEGGIPSYTLSAGRIRGFGSRRLEEFLPSPTSRYWSLYCVRILKAPERLVFLSRSVQNGKETGETESLFLRQHPLPLCPLDVYVARPAGCRGGQFDTTDGTENLERTKTKTIA